MSSSTTLFFEACSGSRTSLIEVRLGHVVTVVCCEETACLLPGTVGRAPRKLGS
jgi:hypothetical protein